MSYDEPDDRRIAAAEMDRDHGDREVPDGYDGTGRYR